MREEFTTYIYSHIEWDEKNARASSEGKRARGKNSGAHASERCCGPLRMCAPAFCFLSKVHPVWTKNRIMPNALVQQCVLFLLHFPFGVGTSGSFSWTIPAKDSLLAEI